MCKSNLSKLVLVSLMSSAFVFGATSAVAAGEETNESMKKMDFTTMDTDKDGYVSMSEGETDAYIKENFKMLDSNADDKIDEAEFAAIEDVSNRKMDNVSVTESFAELDADGNGKLSKEELSGDETMTSMFDDMDMNKDGTVDEKEAMEFDARRKQEVSG